MLDSSQRYPNFALHRLVDLLGKIGQSWSPGPSGGTTEPSEKVDV